MVSSLRLSHLLQHFYRNRVLSLPIVEESNQRFIGFLVRSDIDRLGADLSRLKQEHAKIPDDLLRNKISDKLLQNLAEKESIPVIDELGREIDQWTKSELYRRLATFEEEQAKTAKDFESQSEPVTSSTGVTSMNEDDWLSQLILSSIPQPLLATDLNGTTLFYNENFVDRILERGPFKNTLAIAEKYFLEVNRNALAQTYSVGPHPTDLLFITLSELHVTVQITTLEMDRVIVGYLYIFHDPEVAGLPHEIMSRLEAGLDLDSIMQDLESGIIVSMLRRTGQNVSHAAKALRINRSTLQNKIRRLDVNQRFHRKVEGPVRRIRKKDAEAIPVISDASGVEFDSKTKEEIDLQQINSRKTDSKTRKSKIAKKSAQKKEVKTKPTKKATRKKNSPKK